jgi:K+/H+ antiporter YhaU regulatory subunit KhtT
MDAVLPSLRIHMLTVEAGSFAEGKTIADLDLKSRYGIEDFGLRKNNATTVAPDAATWLQAGDTLIILISDKTSQEIAGLFSGTQC